MPDTLLNHSICYNENVSNQSRDVRVSIAKGIAIILMVVGHSLCNHLYCRDYIYMFHMPLFFFMSGFCFKDVYLNKWKSYIVKRFKKLWCPFVKYNIFFLALHNFFWYLNIYSTYGDEHRYCFDEYVHHLIRIFYMGNSEQLLSAYWFLYIMLAVSLLFLFFRRLTKPSVMLGLFLFVSLLFLLVGKTFPGYKLFFRIFYASAFMVSGYIFSKTYKSKQMSLFFLLVLLVAVGVGAFFWPCEILYVTPNVLFPYYFTAIAGSLMIWGMTRYFTFIGDSLFCRFVIFCGDHTMSLLTWHFLCFKAVSLAIVYVYDLPIQQLGSFPVIYEFSAKGWWIAYATIGVILPLIISHPRVLVRSLTN